MPEGLLFIPGDRIAALGERVGERVVGRARSPSCAAIEACDGVHRRRCRTLGIYSAGYVRAEKFAHFDGCDAAEGIFRVKIFSRPTACRRRPPRRSGAVPMAVVVRWCSAVCFRNAAKKQGFFFVRALRRAHARRRGCVFRRSRRRSWQVPGAAGWEKILRRSVDSKKNRD